MINLLPINFSATIVFYESKILVLSNTEIRIKNIKATEVETRPKIAHFSWKSSLKTVCEAYESNRSSQRNVTFPKDFLRIKHKFHT